MLRCPPDSLFGDNPVGWALGRIGYAMPSVNPFNKFVSSLSNDEFSLLLVAVQERKCREEIGFGTYSEAAALYRPSPQCPHCSAKDAFKDGWSSSGLQRFRCRQCGTRYNSLTKTVLEHCRKELPTWVDFIRLMIYNVPLDACAEICRITHQTAFEWRHRVFATVDGYQDRLVLRDRIWIDETYIVDTDLSKGYGQARKRGLSKQQICIAVAIDVHKNPVAVVCGHGKPSSKRIKEALQTHIANGAVVVHDKERAHNALIRETKCKSESYKADVRDQEYLDSMMIMNSLCSWINRYLWRFTGMDMKNLQSYLNWFVYLFRVHQSEEKWPKIARVVRHMLMTDASFRSST